MRNKLVTCFAITLLTSCETYTDGLAPIQENPVTPCLDTTQACMISNIIPITDITIKNSSINQCVSTVKDNSITVFPFDKKTQSNLINPYQACRSIYYLDSKTISSNLSKSKQVRIDITYRAKFFALWTINNLNQFEVGAYLDEITIGNYTKRPEEFSIFAEISGFDYSDPEISTLHLIATYDLNKLKSDPLAGISIGITSKLRQVNGNSVPSAFFESTLGLTTLTINSVQLINN